MTINVASVRKMTKAPRKDHLLHLPEQRLDVLRCTCGWYVRNVLMSEREKLFKGHKCRGK